MKMFLFLLAVGLVSSEKLDRTYLPPPGAKFSGGSPGDIETPLEYPKETYSTTIRPQQGFNDRTARPDDSQIEVGINRGLPTISEGSGFSTDAHPFGPASKVTNNFQNTYKVPTTTTSYAFTQTTTHPPSGGLETTVSPFDLITSRFPTTSIPNFPSAAPDFITTHLQQGQQAIPGFSQPGDRVIQQTGQSLIPGSNLQYIDSESPTLTPIGQTTVSQNRPGYSSDQFNEYQQPGSNIPGSNIPSLVSQSPFLRGQYQEDQYPTGIPSSGQPGIITSNIPTSTLPSISTIYGDNRDSLQGQVAPGKNIPNLNSVPSQESITTQGDLIQPGNQLILRPGQQQHPQNIEGKFPQRQYTSQAISKLGKPVFSDATSKNIYTPSTISPNIQTSDYSPNVPGFSTSVLPDGTISASTPNYPNINQGNIYTGLVNRPDRPQAEADRNAVILNYENTITPDGNFSYSFDTSNGIHADENGTSADGVKAKGGYSYIGDDGKLYSIVYSADENGFRPYGDHLPTSPPIPEAIQKVIEQAIRNKEAGISDDGTYDEDKYGHKKYQGLRINNRPQGSNKNIGSDSNIRKPQGNRYDNIRKISSDGVGDEYFPGDEELEDDIDDVSVSTTRRPTYNSSKRPVNRLPGQMTGEDDEVVYEKITDNEYNRRDPNNKNSQRRPAISGPGDSSSENSQEFYGDLTNVNKKRPVGKAHTKRPTVGKQPIQIDSSSSGEDFLDDNTKIPIGNIYSKRPLNQYHNSNLEVNNIEDKKQYSNQRRPTTNVPFRQPENQYVQISDVNENEKLEHTEQAQRPDFIDTSNNNNKYYPQQNIYRSRYDMPSSSTIRPTTKVDNTAEYQDQIKNFDDNKTRGGKPSRITENEYTDSTDRNFDVVTGRPINRRPGSYDRYSKPRDKVQMSTTFAPEITDQEQIGEGQIIIPGSQIKGQTEQQKIIKQRPVYGNKYSTLAPTDEETGYQYLPPQTKFEQDVHKFTQGSQGKFKPTEIPSRYYKNKDRIAEPFTTPSVTRGDTENDDIEQIRRKEQQYVSPIKSQPEYRPASDHIQQNIRPELHSKYTIDNERYVPRQPGTQISSTRRPVYTEMQTTTRPQKPYGSELTYENSQDAEHKLQPGQDQNNYFNPKGYFKSTDSTTPLPTQNDFYGTTISGIQKPGLNFDIGESTKNPHKQGSTTKIQPGLYQNINQQITDKPKGSFRLTPTTTPLPNQNQFYETTQTDIQTPGEHFISDIQGSAKRPDEQYNYTGLNEGTRIPPHPYQTTYRPTETIISKLDEYSRTPDFDTTDKPFTRRPGKPGLQYQGQLPSTTYRPPFTFTESNPEVTVDDFKKVDNQYRPSYPVQGSDVGRPVYQTSNDRKSSEQKPGVGRFETPTSLTQFSSTAGPFRSQSTTQKVIGEDFSGPKQTQKFDPKYGYYY